MAGTAIAKDDSWKVDSDIMELLQPFELTTSATPVELKDWIEQFRAFYELSKCFRQSLLAQNSVVTKFMDRNLRSRMRSRTGGVSIPIFGIAKDSYKEKRPEQGRNSLDQKAL